MTHRSTRNVFASGVAAMLLAVTQAHADVRLPNLFSDGMVLQMGMNAPVWGWADNGEKVTVSVNGRTASTTAVDGKWMLRLPKMDYGGPYEMTIAGKNTITLKDVMVGEVWVASGQSNMSHSLHEALNPVQEIAAANYPLIHVFTVKLTVAGEPQSDATPTVPTWAETSPQAADKFSAVPYFFSRDLFQAIHVPIGIINSSVGGTLAEAWTSAEGMANEPWFTPIFTRYNDDVTQYPKDVAAYQQALADWQKAADQATADNKPVPPKPAPPVDPSTETTHPAGLFNGMIAPLIPYGIRGVIWYQGEYNAERAEQYRKLFPALIRDWRKHWGQGNFPFIFVQIANLDIEPQPNLAHYDELREAQLMALSEPNTNMVVASDVGNGHDVHFPNKQEIGRRLALVAEGMVYHQKNVIYSGPIYTSMKVEGDKIRIRFSHTEGGLVSKTGDNLGSFVIAGADQKFVPAQAKIDGDTVVVWSDDVKEPVAVRYAWADNPTMTLYNGGGLPASEFRTDDWPVNTTGKR